MYIESGVISRGLIEGMKSNDGHCDLSQLNIWGMLVE